MEQKNQNQLIDAEVSPSASLYHNVRVIRSTIDDKTSVGDYTTVRDSKVGKYCQIQRYCDLLRVNIGNYTIIERNAVLHDVTIGSFCELSWYVGMGGIIIIISYLLSIIGTGKHILVSNMMRYLLVKQIFSPS